MTIYDIEHSDSIFISNSAVDERESALTEKQYLAMDSADIACSIVKGGKKAIRCGGGYQVFYSIKKANYWENHL